MIIRDILKEKWHGKIEKKEMEKDTLGKYTNQESWHSNIKIRQNRISGKKEFFKF